MTREDIDDKRSDAPFHPFRIHLTDNSLSEVLDSGDILVTETTIFCPTAYKPDDTGRLRPRGFRRVAISHITRIEDIPQKENGSRRRKQ
jgi:hypothetical protein